MTNAEYAKTDKFFHDCCKEAKIPATVRQASKYRNKKGIAYAFRYKVMAKRG